MILKKLTVRLAMEILIKIMKKTKTLVEKARKHICETLIMKVL